MLKLFDYSSLSKETSKKYGAVAFQLARKLFPICRSITGPGLRESLNHLKRINPNMEILNIPTGSKVFDWTVPDEWSIRAAYIIDPSGKKIVDFEECNLHVIGYSHPVDMEISLDELLPHLHSLPEQPNAIPYVTSYYKKRWGFCMTEEMKNSLKPGKYKVYIDSNLYKGNLSYAELLIPSTEAKSNKTIFFSTYICHPSMANNELSGPVTATAIAHYLSSLSYRRYNYRFVFVPETIGSIAYISKNLKLLKEEVIAGFNITCVGDERNYSFLPSRKGQTLADKSLTTILSHYADKYKTYEWSSRGSDERQYCWPGVDLPIASFMKTKYGEYPEYHTSLDQLGTVVTEKGLASSFDVMMKNIELLENNYYFKSTVLCEPQLSSRDLYQDLSIKTTYSNQNVYLEILTHCDGESTFIDIINKIKMPPWEMYPKIKDLIEKGLVTVAAES